MTNLRVMETKIASRTSSHTPTTLSNSSKLKDHSFEAVTLFKLRRCGKLPRQASVKKGFCIEAVANAHALYVVEKPGSRLLVINIIEEILPHDQKEYGPRHDPQEQLPDQIKVKAKCTSNIFSNPYKQVAHEGRGGA